MKKHVVLAGKTTLVRMMCEKPGWKPYHGPVAENPYLEDFYQDMWAFHCQVFFLARRVATGFPDITCGAVRPARTPR